MWKTRNSWLFESSDSDTSLGGSRERLCLRQSFLDANSVFDPSAGGDIFVGVLCFYGHCWTLVCMLLLVPGTSIVTLVLIVHRPPPSLAAPPSSSSSGDSTSSCCRQLIRFDCPVSFPHILLHRAVSCRGDIASYRIVSTQVLHVQRLGHVATAGPIRRAAAQAWSASPSR